MKLCKICNAQLWYNGFKYMHGKIIAGVPCIDEIDYDHEAEVCDHKNYTAAGYPYGDCAKQNVDSDKAVILRVSSLYDVYCLDCGNFVNLLSKEIINEKGLIRYR